MKDFTSIDSILDFAIENEQKAVDFYTELAGNAKNEDMSKVFTQFAKEEMGHKARLTKIKIEGTFNVKNEQILDLKMSDYLVDVEPGPDITYEEALVIAMKREKSAFRLYTNLADRAPTAELKKLFESLAIEESKHKLRFEIEYDDIVMREN
jgi:rubrerythrin